MENTSCLKQGDCLELMKDIPDESVDLILCDLPYGTTKNKWDVVINLDQLWDQYKRLITKHGAIVLFGQEPFSSKLRMKQPKLYRYDWKWRKNTATGFLNARRMPLKCYEDILVFYKHLPIYNPQKTFGHKKYNKGSSGFSSNYNKMNPIYRSNTDGSRFPTDVIEFKKVNMTVHPTQKPVSLLEYLIRTYTNKGDLVLDNTMGSGSTGVAAVNLKRNFIGYELNKDYFDIAKARINNAILSKQNENANNEKRKAG